MKSESKYLTLAWSTAAVLFFVLGTNSAMAGLAGGSGISGSKHDFSSALTSPYKGTSDQTCIYCHTPHGAAGDAALWNRTMGAGPYTPYVSATMNATGTGQPGNLSKLCLSCHDGTIAVDSYGIGVYAVAGVNKVLGTPNIGTDLANDHPVGRIYDAALVTADPGLYPVTTAVTIGTSPAGTIKTKMLFGVGQDQLECPSCHDVHNSPTGTAAGATKLLRVLNTGSALCRTCHNK